MGSSLRWARGALVRARWHVAERWERSRLVAGPPVVELAQVSRRLELLLAALYDRPFAIDAADQPPTAGWVRRYVLHSSGRRAPSTALARHDGDRILLPRALDAAEGAGAAIDRYRILALGQAERIARGTAAHHPVDADRLVRDLYLVAEGVAIDRRLAGVLGGARATLDVMRAAALAGRSRLAGFTRAERAVEWLVRAALGDGPASLHLPATETPAESLAWALDMASRIGVGGRYYGVKPVMHWGTWHPAPAPARGPDDRAPEIDDVLRGLEPPTMPLPVGLPRSGGGGGRDADPALTAGAGDESAGQVEHPAAPPRWVRSPDGAVVGAIGGDSDARPDVRPRPDELRDADVMPWSEADPRLQRAHGDAPTEPGTPYPEWDHVTQRYRERAVTVHGGAAAAGDASWAHAMLREHAALVRGVRQRFGRMRARRVRHRQQRQGEELDLAACVRALVERRAGQSPDDRLYTSVREARPPFAIALLADVSGSTRADVTDALRMIDVEKMALLLAGEALATLGDRYAIFAFAGHGADDVRVTTVKAFGEANGDPVRRRIAALQPDGFTRLGAALRHATAMLEREPARHRLLLVLSDGRPNDIGHYVAEYGLEDSRQAIHEARARAIYPFCLNLDRDRPEYLAHIFGPAGYTTLWRPDQLPRALLQAVQTLIVS